IVWRDLDVNHPRPPQSVTEQRQHRSKDCDPARSNQHLADLSNEPLAAHHLMCVALLVPELPGWGECPVQNPELICLVLAYPEHGGDWLKWFAGPQQAWFGAERSTEPPLRHR